jgi:hypothetical protein
VADDITKTVKPKTVGAGQRLLSQAQRNPDDASFLKKILANIKQSDELGSLGGTVAREAVEGGGDIGKKYLQLAAKSGKLLKNVPKIGLGVGGLLGTLAAEAADSPDAGSVEDTMERRFESGELRPEDYHEIDRDIEGSQPTLEERALQRLSERGIRPTGLADLNIEEEQPNIYSEEDVYDSDAEGNRLMKEVRRMREAGVPEEALSERLKQAMSKYSRFNKLRDQYE